VDPTLVIDLPSWLPPVYAAANSRSVVTDSRCQLWLHRTELPISSSAKSRFTRTSFLQEFSGDALYAASRARGSLSFAFLENKITGVHIWFAPGIGRAATPGRLRLHLPLLGCQHPDDGGFPSIAARALDVKLRVTLRRLEDLVRSEQFQAEACPMGPDGFHLQTDCDSFHEPPADLYRSSHTPVGRLAILMWTLTRVSVLHAPN
jgi:hypothetical protein